MFYNIIYKRKRCIQARHIESGSYTILDNDMDCFRIFRNNSKDLQMTYIARQYPSFTYTESRAVTNNFTRHFKI